MEDKSLEQAVNAATLPGLVGHVLVMPDMHQGYGFPIGGVAATRFPDGVISPGAIGYDINCGVRLLASQIEYEDVQAPDGRPGDCPGPVLPERGGRQRRIALERRRAGPGLPGWLALGAQARLCHRDGPAPHGRRRAVGRRRPGEGQPAGQGARPATARHAGRRQPLHRGRRGRADLRSPGCPGDGAAGRQSGRADPLRLARLRSPDLHRLRAGIPGRGQALWHPPARPRAGVRAAQLARRAEITWQPCAARPTMPLPTARCWRTTPARPSSRCLAGKAEELASAPGVRYRPQHGQDRDPPDRRRRE